MKVRNLKLGAIPGHVANFFWIAITVTSIMPCSAHSATITGIGDWTINKLEFDDGGIPGAVADVNVDLITGHVDAHSFLPNTNMEEGTAFATALFFKEFRINADNGETNGDRAAVGVKTSFLGGRLEATSTSALAGLSTSVDVGTPFMSNVRVFQPKQRTEIDSIDTLTVNHPVVIDPEERLGVVPNNVGNTFTTNIFFETIVDVGFPAAPGVARADFSLGQDLVQPLQAVLSPPPEFHAADRDLFTINDNNNDVPFTADPNSHVFEGDQAIEIQFRSEIEFGRPLVQLFGELVGQPYSDKVRGKAFLIIKNETGRIVARSSSSSTRTFGFGSKDDDKRIRKSRQRETNNAFSINAASLGNGIFSVESGWEYRIGNGKPATHSFPVGRFKVADAMREDAVDELACLIFSAPRPGDDDFNRIPILKRQLTPEQILQAGQRWQRKLADDTDQAIEVVLLLYEIGSSFGPNPFVSWLGGDLVSAMNAATDDLLDKVKSAKTLAGQTQLQSFLTDSDKLNFTVTDAFKLIDDVQKKNIEIERRAREESLKLKGDANETVHFDAATNTLSFSDVVVTGIEERDGRILDIDNIVGAQVTLPEFEFEGHDLRGNPVFRPKTSDTIGRIGEEQQAFVDFEVPFFMWTGDSLFGIGTELAVDEDASLYTADVDSVLSSEPFRHFFDLSIFPATDLAALTNGFTENGESAFDFRFFAVSIPEPSSIVPLLFAAIFGFIVHRNPPGLFTRRREARSV